MNIPLNQTNMHQDIERFSALNKTDMADIVANVESKTQNNRKKLSACCFYILIGLDFTKREFKM